MEFFKKETKIPFMGLSKIAGILSLIACLGSIALLAFKGLNFGLDFTGGTQVELRLKHLLSPVIIKQALEKQGFHGVRAQLYGAPQDVLVRLATEVTEAKLKTGLQTALQTITPDFEIRRVEMVGSEVGQELSEKGGIAVLIAILSTMAYIAMRFEYRLAISAAVGLCHDALLILGFFSLYAIEFELSSLAAILAILGYSLNDTIVVFDRVRENFRKIRRGTASEIMNASINQTLSRTIMTSLLTFLVALSLLLFGGEALFSFSLALCLGIIIGTYSSIFVSGTLAINLGLSKADLIIKPKLERNGELP